MPDKRFIYKGGKYPEPRIDPVCYNPGFFQIELDLESDVFYELRRKNGIEPARINQSSPKDIDEIQDFFTKNKGSFYFLFHESGELIGSALHIRNHAYPISTGWLASAKFPRLCSRS